MSFALITLIIASLSGLLSHVPQWIGSASERACGEIALPAEDVPAVGAPWSHTLPTNACPPWAGPACKQQREEREEREVESSARRLVAHVASAVAVCPPLGSPSPVSPSELHPEDGVHCRPPRCRAPPLAR